VRTAHFIDFLVLRVHIVVRNTSVTKCRNESVARRCCKIMVASVYVKHTLELSSHLIGGFL